MSLTLQQKSVYSVIYNATQIARSLGKLDYFKNNKDRQKEFKRAVFGTVESLAEKIDSGTITNKFIIIEIDKLLRKFKKSEISFGQVQKPINVLLKFHFYLCTKQIPKVKKELDCPLDSVVMEELKCRVSLAQMNKTQYLNIQTSILSFEYKNEKFKTKIDADVFYDLKNTKL